MKQLQQLLNTLRYLLIRQIVWRFWYRYRPKLQFPLSNNVSSLTPIQPWTLTTHRPACLTKQTFEFMGIQADIMQPETWHNSSYPKLWRYHIHYFHDLNHSEQTIELWQTCLTKWAQTNPPGTRDSWEPYPLSLRIVNWITWHLRTEGLTPYLMDHLHTQCRTLAKHIEWHIDANHVWANGKALIFAGCFFPEAISWYQQGMAIIKQQLGAHFLADGGHIELSPMYHALLTQDLFEMIALHQCYTKPYPKEWTNMAKSMLSWAATLTHPDGEYAFFNDCAIGIAPNYTSLCETASQCHITSSSRLENASGYIRREGKQYTLIVDTAAIGCDFQPGHAHADQLSFELSYGKQRILVNSGTSTYDNNDLRHWQRSTPAHNTVTIDGKNSSQVWHAFRVAKRARIIQRYQNKHLMAATHDGYQRLRDPVLHSRQWRCCEDHIAITDHIQGKHSHHLTWYCYFHPDLKLQKNKTSLFVSKQQTLLATLHFPNETPFTLETGCWYPCFGKAIPNQHLKIELIDHPLPFTLHWDIEIHGT